MSEGQGDPRVALQEAARFVDPLGVRPVPRRSVGDIYVGKVEAVLPGIQAAFVDIGAEKSAFLHASDLIESEDEENPAAREPDDADENGNGGGGHGGSSGNGWRITQAVANL